MRGVAFVLLRACLALLERFQLTLEQNDPVFRRKPLARVLKTLDKSLPKRRSNPLRQDVGQVVMLRFRIPDMRIRPLCDQFAGILSGGNTRSGSRREGMPIFQQNLKQMHGERKIVVLLLPSNLPAILILNLRGNVVIHPNLARIDEVGGLFLDIERIRIDECDRAIFAAHDIVRVEVADDMPQIVNAFERTAEIDCDTVKGSAGGLRVVPQSPGLVRKSAKLVGTFFGCGHGEADKLASLVEGQVPWPCQLGRSQKALRWRRQHRFQFTALFVGRVSRVIHLGH